MNKLLLPILAAGLLRSGAAGAQSLTIVSTHSYTAGHPINNATASFTPTYCDGIPHGYRLGVNGGQVGSGAVTAPVVNGYFSLAQPDVSQTYPTNICLSAAITDNATKNVLVAYPNMQPTSAAPWCSVITGATVCRFDDYTNTPPTAPGGSAGATGPAGPQGPSGAQGMQGPQGNDGRAATIAIGQVQTLDPSASATVGNAGTASAAVLTFGIPRGLAGAQGPTGATGSAGVAGAQGPQGMPGVAGPAGIQGLTGPSGPVGPIGPSGLQGIQGMIGPAGSVGATGAAGATGPSGPAGATGPAGPQGVPGSGVNDGSIAVQPVSSGDPVAAANTAINQVLDVGPSAGAHTPFPLTSGSALHDRSLGSEGDRYVDCLYQQSMHFNGIDGNACQWNHATFDSDAGDVYGQQMLRVNSLWSFGKSANYSSNWRVVSLTQERMIVSNRGIASGHTLFYQKNAAGDTNVENHYSYIDGGWQTQSDEAGVGNRNYFFQMGTYYHGLSQSSGTGVTMPSLGPYTGAPGVNYDADHTIDGGILLDITKGAISGAISGPSAPLAGSGYLNTFPTGGGLPLTTAWGICNTPIPNQYQPQVNLPFTCTVTLKSGQFTAGGLVWVAGPNYPEQAPITAAGAVSGGTQSITISVRNPQPNGGTQGVNIFQGGLQGQYLSFDANLAFSTIRTSYFAFGSLDGVNLIYGFFITGGSAVMMDCGAQQFCGGVPGRNGFHLYPGAEIIANHSIHHDPELEPNAIPFSVGDQLEGPPPVAISITANKTACGISTPANGGGAVCDYVSVSGPGLNANFLPHQTWNTNDPAMYTNNGGNLSGMTMHRVRGYFDIGESFDIMPGGALFNVGQKNYNNTGCPLSQVFSFTGSGQLYWNWCAAQLFSANIGATYLQHNYIAGPASAPGIGSACPNNGLWQLTQDGKATVCLNHLTAEPYAPPASIAPVVVALPTTAIAAGACAAGTVSMPGLTTASSFGTSFVGDPTGVTGYGATDGLTFKAWPTANTFNYKECNSTAASVTPGAQSINVGAK